MKNNICGAIYNKPFIRSALASYIHASASIVLILSLYSFGSRLHLLAKSERACVFMEYTTFLVIAFLSLIMVLLRIPEPVEGGGRHTHGYNRDKKIPLYGLIALFCILPCPGASMILLLTLYPGLAHLGVPGVIVMSLFMCRPLFSYAYPLIFYNTAIPMNHPDKKTTLL